MEKLFVVFLLLFASVSSRATHLVGGDIIYKCLGNNRYEISFVLYQDCMGGGGPAIDADNPLNYAIYLGTSDTFVRGDSIFLFNTTRIPSEFANECITNAPSLCLQRQTFTTVITLPANNVGYTIYYQRCCRNNSVRNIIDPGNTGVTFSAFIPPFANNVCANNSATFKNFPPQIICSNYPFVYDFSAIDSDADSITYALCEAYPGASTSNSIPKGEAIYPPSNPVNYRPPYSAQFPLPGSPGLSIDSRTGLMTGTPTTQGRYIVTVCATEWRNGVKVNMISRDVQFLIYDCSKAVVANMPSWKDEEDTYIIVCDGYTVNFENTSEGGFTYLWDFGDGSSSTQEFPTHTYSDTGVYNVTLTVNPGTTCTDRITKKVKIYPYIVPNFTYSGIMCPGEVISFVDSSSWSFGNITSWSWNFNGQGSADTKDAQFAFPAPGGPQNVTLTVTSEIGCSSSISKILPVDNFDPYAGNDTIIVLGYPFRLNGQGSYQYEWSPFANLSDRNIPNPDVDFRDTGVYTYVLKATSLQGCIKYDTIKIQVVLNPHMFMPNAFTPNGDGLNDVLRPTIVGFSLINTFEVYNRYGQLVYKSANENAPGWDGSYNGRPADVGVYFWNIEATNPITNKRENFKGDVTLLR